MLFKQKPLKILLLLFLLSSLATMTTAQENCVIPDSGTWPECATRPAPKPSFQGTIPIPPNSTVHAEGNGIITYFTDQTVAEVVSFFDDTLTNLGFIGYFPPHNGTQTITGEYKNDSIGQSYGITIYQHYNTKGATPDISFTLTEWIYDPTLPDRGTECIIPVSGAWPQCAKDGQTVYPNNTADDGFSIAVPLPKNSTHIRSEEDHFVLYESAEAIDDIRLYYNHTLPKMGYQGYIDPYYNHYYEFNTYLGSFHHHSKDKVINLWLSSDENKTLFYLVSNTSFVYDFPIPAKSYKHAEELNYLEYRTMNTVESLIQTFNYQFSQKGYTGELTMQNDGNVEGSYYHPETKLTYQLRLMKESEYSAKFMVRVYE